MVEDEDGVRTQVGRVLEKLGYHVLSATNGPDATRVSREYRERIDLLITDVVMPAMGGPGLAQHMTISRPGLKVLFRSGYTGQAIIHHGVLSEETPLLTKPFTPQVLARKVRDVLDTSGDSVCPTR